MCDYNCPVEHFNQSGSSFGGRRACLFLGRRLISFLLELTDALTLALQPHERLLPLTTPLCFSSKVEIEFPFIEEQQLN